MQKRLTQTLVAVALSAVLLVGAGVLLLATLGARDDARRQVEQQLVAIADVANTTGDRERADNALVRIAEGFDVSSVTIVRVSDSGRVSELRGRPDRDGPAREDTILSLDDKDVNAFDDGESIVLDTAGSVTGLRRLDFVDDRRGPENRANLDRALGVLVRQDIATIGSQAGRWFLFSGAFVVLASIIAAWWLAQRFTAPVRAVTAATGSIADGDLSVRVAVDRDDELGDLGASVNRMAGELERGRAMEQQFLLSVSHDLRTPLTAIAGYAEALVDGAVAEPQRAGEIISHHAGRLDRLVGDLLDLARLESRQFRLEPRPIDPVTAARTVVESCQPTAVAHNLSILLDAPADVVGTIHVDPDRLGQVLSNLVENAVKFATSMVTVRVTPLGGEMSIQVIDDGPGIPADDLPHVFERLYVTQLKPKRAENSSGLGLAIVRELVAAMRGTVTASATDAGTIMTLTFPAAEPSAADHAPSNVTI